MSTLDAFHLPGLDLAGHPEWTTLDYGDVALRVPALEPDHVRSLASTLIDARARHLAHRPVADIVDAIDAAAARLRTGSLRETAEAVVPATARYSPAMVRLVLDRMSADWTGPALRRLLDAELGDGTVLDRFVPDPAADRQVYARGPDLAFHVFAGNVPGVAVTAAIRSLLVRAATLAKTAADEPMLPVLFARALADVDAGLGDCIAVTYWPGTRDDLNEAAAGEADAVVVYGGDEAAGALHRMARPSARFVLHGPRVSFGMVGREADAGTADRVARATAIFDQHGCVSPHVVYVEQGGETSPEAFAGKVAAALDVLETELPRGPVSTTEAAAIQQARGAAEFRQLAGRHTRVFAGPGTRFTVIFDDDATFTPSCLNRTLWVKPVPDLQDVPAFLRPVRRFLQSVAIAGAGARLQPLALQLADLGVARITDFDHLPWPPAEWHHDGRGPLRELLRWSDLDVQRR
jgi:hypothetical protein